MRQPIWVLHVDDEPEFTDVVGTFLEREEDRIRVRTATGATEALDRLADEPFDCVVSDYDMPGQNGIEFLETVRETYPDLPFILYTGKGSEEIASDAISAGVTDYLEKGSGTSQYTVLANRIENLVAQFRAESSLETTRRRYQRLIEESSDVFAILDGEGRFKYLSPSVERVLGYRPDELLDDPSMEYIHPDDRESLSEQFETLLKDPSFQLTVEHRFEDSDGTWQWIESRGRNLLDDQAIEGIVMYGRDVTERKRRERVLKQLHDATRTLLRAETKQEAADVIGEAAENVLGYSNNVVRLLSEDEARLEPVSLVSDGLPPELEKRPTYEVGQETAGVAFERGEPIVYDDVRDLVDDKERHGARAGAYLPIGDHGVLTITEFERDVFDEADVQLASILTANAAIALDRIDHQREQETRLAMLSELNEMTTRLFRAGTPEEICELTAEASRDVLGYPNTVVRLLDETRDVLVPTVVTERAREELGDRPEYPVGEGTAGRAYAAQEPLLYEDAKELNDEYPRKDGRGAVYIPIGEYGTISIADTTPGEFDESDVEIAQILAAAAEAALYRVKQQETVERQNERLDNFTSVVSHDLRNPLSVATGRLKLLEEECECGAEHVEGIEDALDRMETLIDDLLALAWENRNVADREPISLRTVVEDSWANVETGESTLVVEVDRTIEGDESRLKQLFENLIRNAVEHGETNSRTRSGGVTVTVGERSGGFYVEDDGPGIPEDEYETVFEVGYSSSPTGNGFGLAIVNEIVEAHNWQITATEGTDGGARFEITGVGLAAE